ncbi:MAG: DNA recombination protein RmuC [Clostridiaceae bacterium]|nr:DNA recombination protein RmuC [Clostridiaceae bacterium]
MLEKILLSLALLAAAFSGIMCLVMLGRLKSIEKHLSDIERKEADGGAIMARQDMLINTVEHMIKGLKADMTSSAMQSDQKLDLFRRGIENALTQMRRENAVQLDAIRGTVDEKLQDTLDKKLSESFAQVSQRLEQVYRGLGEMQSLASGVGDLKRVLSNVKTRGMLGEIQLGAILEQMLSPEQYGQNVAVKPGSQANVEFAIKLPGTGEDCVWLPVDSKFPLDCYEQLLTAYESGDGQAVEKTAKELRDRLKRFAKDIHDKYIAPPHTTDFAVMFLPAEGLYAEAVKMGMVETLQREFKVSIAGPTTMGALLNSLQMGFKTLAIQKRSSEVWRVLSAVKTEFDTFGSILEMTQKRILQANDELDRLVGVRTRKIQSTLKGVQSLSGESETNILEEYTDNV